MGKADTKTKEFWRNNEHFADLFNTVLFGGQQVLRAEELQEKDSDLSASVPARSRNDYVKMLAKASDVVKKQSFGVEFSIFTLQNQSRIDYSMPVRELADSALIYLGECRAISERNRARREGIPFDELFSIGRDDRIHAVISLTVYYGEKPWDGPRSLRGMMADMPAALEKIVPDYPLNLVEVRSSDQYAFSNPDVATLFALIRSIYRKDLNAKVLRRVSADMAMTVGEIVKSEKIVTLARTSRKGGEINMCQALEEMMQDSKEDGIKEGVSKGKLEAYKDLVRKKLAKGKTAEQIAEELEEQADKIFEIIAMLQGETA